MIRGMADGMQHDETEANMFAIHDMSRNAVRSISPGGLVRL